MRKKIRKEKCLILALLVNFFFTNKLKAETINLPSNEDLIISEYDNNDESISKESSFLNNESIKIDGRIVVDFGTALADETNSMKDKILLRRAWIGAGGKIRTNWKYRFLVGTNDNQFRTSDIVLINNSFKNTDILVGQFFENNGLEISTVNLIPTFTEFSAGIATFRAPRKLGISVDPYGENWGMHLGLFGSAIHNPGMRTTNANNNGKAASTRFHLAAINNKIENHFLHLGLNNSYRILDKSFDPVTGSNRTMRFKSSGDIDVIHTNLIDSGKINDVANYYQNMLEFRYQKGSFALTSEYLKTTLNRSTGLGNLNFSGGYVTASYFLTGEYFGYDSKKGLPTAPRISSNGAWEIGARYSNTNLNSKNIHGGNLKSYDLALNYYPNNHTRLMLNYIYNETDNFSIIRGNPQYLIFRTQVSF